jgi:hypothetical protein
MSKHIVPAVTVDYRATPGDRETRKPRPRTAGEADRP